MPRKKAKQRDDDDVVVDDRDPMLPMGGGQEDDSMRSVGDAMDERAEQDIELVLGELGSGTRVKIARVNPETGNAAHVGEMKAEAFSLDALAEHYGGGVYILRIVRGKEQVGPHFRQEIDPSIPPKNPRSPRNAQQQGGQNDMVMAMMLQSQQQSAKLTEVMMTMMTGFSTAMLNVMQAKDSGESPLEMATKLVELTRGPTREPRAFSELVEAVDLVDKLRGGAEGGDGTTALIGKAIETVGKIVDKSPSMPPARYPVTTPTPRTAVVPQPAPVQIPEQAPTIVHRPWVAAILPIVPSLVPFVGTVEPGTVADLISQRLSDEDFADLASDILSGMNTGDPITADACMAFARGASEKLGLGEQSVPWLAEVAKEIIEIVNEPDETETQP